MSINPYQTPNSKLSSTSNEDYDYGVFWDVKGRMGRKSFIAHTFLVAVSAIVALVFLAQIGSVGKYLGLSRWGAGGMLENVFVSFFGVTALVVVSMLIYAGVILQIRRLHDMNVSGWLCLLSFVPVVNYFFIPVLLLVPGTRGKNNYGLEFRPAKDWENICFWLFMAVPIGLLLVFILIAV